MRYELLLQTMTPGTPYEAARVDALLSERQVSARPDGVRVWRLRSGEVEVGELREGGQVVATELRVPLSDRPDLMRELLGEAAALATAAGARLVDPQLGRSLAATDDGVVVEQYGRTARYAAEVAGLPEAMGTGSYAATSQESRGFQPSGRFFLIAIGVFFALYLVVDSLLSKLNGS
ncbi:hypothetical protein [Pyxidicoccus xibeiensis]|uniref:hypothetical protein n=1 Tax=Pyxidicoccus xibeiensis TaxID=2906759 RepID=UPI0020A7C129|nr:hypothetical protein [Pyxidicoccus xibeiensis]MCP3140149.1 hypothetical protein [Pyxidicoccus xibeiensis]